MNCKFLRLEERMEELLETQDTMMAVIHTMHSSMDSKNQIIHTMNFSMQTMTETIETLNSSIEKMAQNIETMNSSTETMTSSPGDQYVFLPDHLRLLFHRQGAV